MKTETENPSPKPLHEIILEMFYFESKDKPCKLTAGEVYWKFKDPSVSEFQIEEVLNWMVRNKKLNENLGYYTLDKHEALALDEKFEQEKEAEIKQSQKPKIATIVLNYVVPSFLVAYTLFIFFLINKLHSTFEIKNQQHKAINSLTVTELKGAYIKNNKNPGSRRGLAGNHPKTCKNQNSEVPMKR